VKVVFEKKSLRRILKWCSVALFACAILLLGYCGFALVDAWLFRGARAGISTGFARRAAEPEPPQPVSVHRSEGRAAATWHGLVGRIEIPRLRLSVVVIEGVDQNRSPARGRTYSRHGAAGRGRQRGAGRAPRHVLSPAEGCED
jgi:hypothetical protein